jgi:hypothetical protein
VEAADGSHCPIPPNIREMYKGGVDMNRSIEQASSPT